MMISLKKERKESLLDTLFIVPAVVFILFFILWPIIQSLALSFYKWDGVGPWEFVGINNYIKMFTRDKFFYLALKNTTIFTVVTTIGEMAIGLTLAILIDLGIRGWKAFRFIFFLPVALSQVAISLLWVKIYARDGLINSFLGVIGLETLQRVWLGDARYALWCVCLVSIWQYGGWHMIFFLAGMQGIDPQIYESAKIDGASTIRRIFSITLPLLKNVFFIITILSLILGFKNFDLVYVLTTGGPAHATEVLTTQVYQHAFDVLRFGYASVLAVILVVISLIFSLFYIKVTGYRKEITEDL
jgi:raffinose/stachyose/melibiose transport system permease protein